MADTPPQDTEILAVLSEHEGGLTPIDLFQKLSETHSQENVIAAIQRAFGRGIVRLSTGARLVPSKEVVAEAA